MPGLWRLHCPTAVLLTTTAHDREGGEASWPRPHLWPTDNHTTITATYTNNHPPTPCPLGFGGSLQQPHLAHAVLAGVWQLAGAAGAGVADGALGLQRLGSSRGWAAG